MKGGTLQIIWHDSLPVLSLDFHNETRLLATAGADHDIKLWSVAQKDEEKGTPFVLFKANLSFHTTAVNVIRFSPSGDLLASGADGGHLALWKRALNAESVMTWKVMKPLSFHPKDVLDLEWSPDGTSLISGSVDNSCIIWSVAKGAPLQVLNDHLHYVQGVAWDPAGQYIATVSGDRTCRIYMPRTFKSNSKLQEKHQRDNGKGQLQKFVCQHVLAKVHLRVSTDIPVQMEETDNVAAKMATRQHLFHDENLPTFFRRLAWSPEGSFLVIPAGIYKPSSDAATFNTTCIVSRRDLSRPALQLPCGKKPVVAVRFCPIIFTLRVESDSWEAAGPDGKVFRLPYRLVFAVATLNSLYIYDTQSDSPVAILAGLHYAAITDLAWSPDAKFLAVSSQDGYCTLLAFEDGELGQPMPIGDIPRHIASYLPEERRKLAKSLVESSSSPNKKDEDEASVIETSQVHLERKGCDQKVVEEGLHATQDTTPEKQLERNRSSVSTVSLPPKPRRLTPSAISDCSVPGEYASGNIATSQLGTQPNIMEHKKIRRLIPILVLPEGAP